LLVQQYGLWIYGILFFIIFAETGFVVTPFLPGDSLLFVAGALAAIGEGGMDIVVLMGVADHGRRSRQYRQLPDRPLPRAQGLPLGEFAFLQQGGAGQDPCLLREARRQDAGDLALPAALSHLRAFRRGHRGDVLCRFTFFNLIGALAWVVSLCLAGYWLGNVPWVKQNLTADHRRHHRLRR
jgi:membrane-associated protein